MKIIFRVLLIGWCFLIFYLSRQTGGESLETSIEVSEILDNSFKIGTNNDLLRNFAHFIEYFILSCLIYINFIIIDGKKEYVMLIVFIVSVFDEINQLLTPGRVMSFYDLLIDNTGNVLGYMCMSLLNKLKASFRN
ncbi:VanZ family protein [Mycoplasmatota bacterium WC44]